MHLLKYEWIKSVICKYSQSDKPDYCPDENGQSDYFLIISEQFDQQGNQLCLANSSEKGEAIVERCDSTKFSQLWTTNAIGELKTKEDNNLCLSNLQGQKVLRMEVCKLIPDQVFVFDYFFNSLLWIKNKHQSAKYGLRALTIISDISPDEGAKVYIKKRKGKPTQRWSIEQII